jgi:hypothetical protein
MKKSQNVLVWLSLVLVEYFWSGCQGWQQTQQSLTPAVDWQDGLIGSGGLLILVSHLLQWQFQFFG